MWDLYVLVAVSPLSGYYLARKEVYLDRAKQPFAYICTRDHLTTRIACVQVEKSDIGFPDSIVFCPASRI
jgi:hypothetical protein